MMPARGAPAPTPEREQPSREKSSCEQSSTPEREQPSREKSSCEQPSTAEPGQPSARECEQPPTQEREQPPTQEPHWSVHPSLSGFHSSVHQSGPTCNSDL
ncbi:hypothetical protein FJT64_015902 [Amphibalanus amphitrite]|uniref:Uncharacterized protein n=1 Tax=Amphibalanus amphitrite TaxID=1232801 RepID=A0A6A4XG06_AMPAM|nr:hypothetical protein FJT64_015902 [Amphibalanus amphitrite]